MISPVVLSTAVVSLFGFLLNSTILYLILSRGRKTYHYLFAGILLICAIWDLGVFLCMLRNNHEHDLIRFGVIASTPASFLPALIYHFTSVYLGRKDTVSITLIWAYTLIAVGLSMTGVYGYIDGIYNYRWGNIFRLAADSMLFNLSLLVFWFGPIWISCRRLYRAARTDSSMLGRRHKLYITAGFLVISLVVVKTAVVLGIDAPYVLPLGMLLNDLFVALIGIAIVKEQLFDLTVVIKKGMLYSVLAGLFVFIFSFSEHILATYLGEYFGGHSEMTHFVAIAIVIGVLLPIKQRIEDAVDHFFTQKKLEF